MWKRSPPNDNQTVPIRHRDAGSTAIRVQGASTSLTQRRRLTPRYNSQQRTCKVKEDQSYDDNSHPVATTSPSTSTSSGTPSSIATCIGQHRSLVDRMVESDWQKDNEKREEKRDEITQQTPPQQTREEKSRPSLRALRRAAVTLTMAPGSQGKYGDLLKEVGLTDIRYHRALNDGVILEISGKDSATKADSPATRLKQTFQGKENVRVARPTKKANLGLVDDSITPGEVVQAVASAGNYDLDVVTEKIRHQSPKSIGSIAKEKSRHRRGSNSPWPMSKCSKLSPCTATNA